MPPHALAMSAKEVEFVLWQQAARSEHLQVNFEFRAVMRCS
jgi:hypothetical protein